MATGVTSTAPPVSRLTLATAAHVPSGRRSVTIEIVQSPRPVDDRWISPMVSLLLLHPQLAMRRPRGPLPLRRACQSI
jgi:hypothetical protein